MEKLSFIKQYIARPRVVGAILPSSKSLAARMIEDIDFQNAGCIVEYGPGTGVFTEKIINNINADTVLLVIENNYDFYSMLKLRYRSKKNVYIVLDSAENVDKHLTEYGITHADYIVSGLPFASLPKSVSHAILYKSKSILKKDGKFITFQYTMLKRGVINRYFNNIEIKRELLNFPPAYVFSCSNP